MGVYADLIIKLSGEGKNLAQIVTAVAKLEEGKVPRIGLEFAQWWHSYPNKVAKGDAEKAYAKARTLASAEVLLDGVQRYAAKQDDRPWCNAGTWLRQRRWEDEEPQPMQPPLARGIAGARQRLEREIAHGSAPHLGHQGTGDRLLVGLPLLDQRR